MTTIIIAGPSGCGKTSLAGFLANTLGWTAWDADSYHSEHNRRKLAKGDPLTDDDREEWLTSLRNKISEFDALGQNNVLACSALKANYRRYLRAGKPNVKFVLLNADIETVTVRVNERIQQCIKDKLPPPIASPKIIQSQFDTLEMRGEIDLVLDAILPLDILAQTTIEKLQLN